MDESTKNSPCKECTEGDGAQCRTELEHLRRHLADRDSHIIALEAEFIKTTGRASNLEEQLDTWREKYERLYDSHKRVQKLNQVLEDKLLQMVDKMKGEKHQLTKDIATLSVRLAESKHNYGMLQKENERYKNDMNLAIQLLQCKPDNFVSHKLDNLSVDTQARVSQYVMSKSKPPGSSHSKNGNDMETFDSSEYEFNISASLMSKILEDSIQDTVTKHCDTCSCSNLQSQPFCYNESHYSVATQTALSGEMKNSLCLNCNTDVKSGHSGLSVRSVSPHGVKLINEKSAPYALPGPLYIVSQPAHNVIENTKVTLEKDPEKVPNEGILNDIKIEENMKYEANVQKEISKIGEEIKQIRKNSAMNMEPAVHHKLCDRTKTPISSKKSTTSLGNEDALMKDLTNPLKDTKTVAENQIIDNISIRKNSLSSMGAVSRTSSVAKSTTSTHKSNTQVGPGPRFCSLRMHPGSKNILLDNAQPDVPPVLYRRQSKCNENNIFKEVEGVDNFVNLAKKDENTENGLKHDNLVVESTLIDVHVDNNNKETSAASKTSSINPILMNVSSSPLQPLKTHNFSNGSEQNNNPGHSITSQTNTSGVDNLLNGFNSVPTNDIDIKTKDEEGNVVSISNKTDLFTPTDNHDVKIFNFDRYEQNKLSSQYVRPLKMIDMSNLHSLENTRISKDLPPQGELPKIVKKEPLPPKNLSTIVNVYPNLTQTHLKVNESKKVFTNEQSTSSLSSDDSAAILQKQQLLRVAEWVEQNLEQQNNLNDPLEEDVSFNTKLARRESRINRLTDTLNELALNMPHPVSKYSKSYTRDDHKNWVHSNPEAQRSNHSMPNNSAALPNAVNHFAKETEFPVEGDEPNTKTSNAVALDENVFENIGKNLSEALKNGDREITAEELARMEYNVKKFLLSGPQWANPESVGRSRRTSSKTETDV